MVRELQKNTVAPESYTTGKETSDCHFESFELFLQSLTHRKDGSIVILIDDNMYYGSMRYKYYQLARKCKCWSRTKVLTNLVGNFQTSKY